MRTIKKFKVVHAKLIRGLHHEGVTTAEELPADARDVSKLPRGVLSYADLNGAASAYDGVPSSIVVATSLSALM